MIGIMAPVRVGFLYILYSNFLSTTIVTVRSRKLSVLLICVSSTNCNCSFMLRRYFNIFSGCLFNPQNKMNVIQILNISSNMLNRKLCY